MKGAYHQQSQNPLVFIALLKKNILETNQRVSIMYTQLFVLYVFVFLHYLFVCLFVCFVAPPREQSLDPKRRVRN